MQRSWSAPDKWPQLPNERQLHHCLHVTDGWQCWQTGRINWRGYQGQTAYISRLLFLLLALVLSTSRCIFIQMQREETDRWPSARVLLRWFNAKQSICVYQFPVYTKDRLLHNWAVVWCRTDMHKGNRKISILFLSLSLYPGIAVQKACMPLLYDNYDR